MKPNMVRTLSAAIQHHLCSMYVEAKHKHEILEMLLSASSSVASIIPIGVGHEVLLNGPSSYICQRLGHRFSTIRIGVCIPLAFLWTRDAK